MAFNSTKDGKEYPIFDLFDISELARRTGYSEIHLVNVKRGTLLPGKRFKWNCSLALGISQAELFGSDEANPHG